MNAVANPITALPRQRLLVLRDADIQTLALVVWLRNVIGIGYAGLLLNMPGVLPL
jgi:hypothetical protein